MRVLQRLHVHLQERPREPLPQWIVLELLKSLNSVAAGCSLPHAFGMSTQARDSALRRCAELIDPLGSDWRRAERIAALLAYAKRPGWCPRTETDEALATALAAAPVPSTPRRIFEIVRTSDANAR